MSDPDPPTPPTSPAVPCTFDGFVKDAGGCYPLTALLNLPKDCSPVGACFSSSTDAPVDQEPPQPIRKPKRKPMSDPVSAPTPHRDVPQRADDHADDFVPARDPAAFTKALEARRITVDVVDTDGPAPSAPALPQATTQVPAAQTAVGELGGLLPKDGSGGSAVTVMLAMIAVAGGGAGWKFYQSFARQKHEQRMKELEIKEKKVEQQGERDDNHQKCAVERQALEAKVAALEARIAEAEKAAQAAQASKQDGDKSAAWEMDVDFDEVKSRIEHLEKVLEGKVKAAPKKPARTPKTPKTPKPPKATKVE